MTQPTEPPALAAARTPSAWMRAAAVAYLLLVGALPWSIASLSVTAAICAALTLGWLLGGKAPRWPRTPVDVAAIAWLAAMLLSALFAEDRAGSLLRLKKGLFPALVPLVAFHAADRARGVRAVGLLLASASIASTYGLALFVLEGASFAARARGPSGHYMTFGGQLLLLVSLAAGIALLARERRWRMAGAGMVLLGGAALAATFTRSSWIGLAAALGVMFVTARPRLLPVAAVALAALIVLAPPQYRERALSAFDPHHPANRERTLMWQAGARMFLEHPVTGVGVADLRPVYERYRPPGAHEHAAHLHSVPVQIAATMGSVGLAAFALLYGALFRASARGLRGMVRRGGLAAGVRLGVTGALAGFLAAGLFEWNFGDEELLYLLYSLVGLAWAARGWDGTAGGAAAPAGEAASARAPAPARRGAAP